MNGVMASLGGIDETLVQTGLLSSVRKQWSKSRVKPEAGFALFTIRAAGSTHRDAELSGVEMGTLAGYMLKVAFTQRAADPKRQRGRLAKLR